MASSTVTPGVPIRAAARRHTLAFSLRPLVVGLYLAAVLVVLGTILAFIAFCRAVGDPLPPVTRGVLWGAGGATVMWVLWTATIMFDGSWSWRVGATAESWTADALRRLGREWRFFYNLPFYGGTIETPTWRTDIDCAAVGPGGVYAVSTKWTGDAWDLSDPTDDWVATAARQAARNAANLAPRVRNAVRGVEPVPIVVVWGPHLEDIAALRTIAAITVGERAWDVWVLNGRQARDWLQLMQSARLRPDEVTKVAGAAAALQSDYRDRAGRTAKAVRDAHRSARFARALVATAAIASAADVVLLIAADTATAVARTFGSLVRAGHGGGGTAVLLGPSLLAIGAAVWTRRVTRRCRAARVPLSRAWLMTAVAAGAAWLLAVLAAGVVG